MHSFPGFCRLRMYAKGGSPVAFVEYQDVRYAAQAMSTLQGSLLVSSDRGAIRIEYAKSKMAEVGFTNLWMEVRSSFYPILFCLFLSLYVKYRKVLHQGGCSKVLESNVRYYSRGWRFNVTCDSREKSKALFTPLIMERIEVMSFL